MSTDPSSREAPTDLAWDLGRKLRDRRETRDKLEKLNAECDALAKRLGPLVPEQGLYLATGPNYDRAVIHLQRDRTRGVTATLVPTVDPSELEWPETPESVGPPSPAERAKRVDDTIRRVVGNSELCTVPDTREC